MKFEKRTYKCTFESACGQLPVVKMSQEERGEFTHLPKKDSLAEEEK
jgi:hypothetical protein